MCNRYLNFHEIEEYRQVAAKVVPIAAAYEENEYGFMDEKQQARCAVAQWAYRF